MAGLTKKSFHFLATGALGVNMIALRRSGTGVSSHSRDLTNSLAYVTTNLVNVKTYARKEETHFVSSSIVDHPNLSNLSPNFR